jgi:hypothetical protein
MPLSIIPSQESSLNPNETFETNVYTSAIYTTTKSPFGLNNNKFIID